MSSACPSRKRKLKVGDSVRYGNYEFGLSWSLTSCVYSSVLSHYSLGDRKGVLASKGYWQHQRADERHGKPTQGNQELLVAKDKVGRPPGELGVSKSIGCDMFHSVL